jgi:O-antigen/teichoic acid export membrane protein
MSAVAGGSPTSWIARARSSRLLGQSAWVGATFVLTQIVRLVTNIVLASLLAPAVFGIMIIVTTVRVGIELLTDTGIGQSILIKKEGGNRDFIATAWAIQAGRGVLLFLVCLVIAWPVAAVYEQPILGPVIAVTAVMFLLTGFAAPSQFVMQKRRMARELALYQLALAVLGAVAFIAFAWSMPNVWGVVWGTVATGVIFFATSFMLPGRDGIRPSFHPEHARTMLSYGKWIFLSTLLYFACSNFDRLYLPTQLSLALFGIYGIARSMSELAVQLMQKICGLVVLPAIASVGEAIKDHRHRVAKMRFGGLALVSVAIGTALAGGDLFIDLAYDQRYQAAQIILPLLLLGSWFSTQAAAVETLSLGLARPDVAAYGNLAKLVWVITFLPLTFAQFGLLGGIVAIALADLPRYATLSLAQYRHGHSFFRQDFALFLLFLLTAFAIRWLLVAAGLIDGFVTSDQQAQLPRLG